MKNVLITHASSTDLVIDGEAMLGLSVATFSKTVVSAIDELSTVHGHTTNRVVGAVSGALRRELGKRVLKAEGLISASMSGAIMDKDEAKIKMLTEKVTAVADWIEALYEEYKPHADILGGLSSYEVEFHPFQRRQARSYTVDNELDAEEHEEYTFDESEDYMDDMASLWLEEQSLIADMSQAELRTQKVNATQAMDSEPQYEIYNITKEEWIEERLYRKEDEWFKAAAYGAWDAIQNTLDRAKADPVYPLVVETIGELSEKKLGAATKILRKAIDLEIRVERLESRKEYIYDQIHKMDNTSEELTIAAMSNSVRDDEITELQTELRDAYKVSNFLNRYAKEFEKWLSLVELEVPHRVYSSYVAFDPVQFLVDQMIKKAGYMGERVSPRSMAKFQKDALKLLGNPTTIESFVIEDGESAGLELWGIHFTRGEHEELKKAATEIGKVRAIKFRHDELAARELKLDKIVKSAAMRNKKPTSPFELEAITKKFLF
ncbi:hypothetical protein [Pseudoalteromonas sp. CH_XMU1449-3]|uniref:hypothetical protein n=1 Tax=Pseudoalteromonas sp. CH_XMU1449-3 TaxID=3107774 RepID=UPI00300A65BE